MEMDKESREELQKILAKDRSTLTDQDKQFLTARRDHLSREDQKEYADVFKHILSVNASKDEQAPDEVDEDEETDNQ